MARKDKDKSGVSKIRKKLNKEFERTSSQVEALIGDALKQISHLQHQIQDPVRKLISDLEHIREREMKRLHDEFERRMNELHEVQSSMLERLGVGSKAARKSLVDKASRSTKEAPKVAKDKAETVANAAAESAAETATHGKAIAKSAKSTSKPAKAAKAAKSAARSAGDKAKSETKAAADTAKASASAGAPKGNGSAQRSPASEKQPQNSQASGSGSAEPVAGGSGAKPQATSGGKSGNGSGNNRDTDLTRIKGIGPVTAQRLQEKGIARIQQVANPSPEDQKVLEQFKTGRGLEVWKENAQKLGGPRQ